MAGYALYAWVCPGRIRIGVTSAPEVMHARLASQTAVSSRLADFRLLTRPVPLWVAEEVLRHVGSLDLTCPPWQTAIRWWQLRLRCRQALLRTGEPAAASPGAWVDDVAGDKEDEVSHRVPAPDELTAAAALLAGRSLLESEARRLFAEEAEGEIESDAADLIDVLAAEGRVRRIAAVARDRSERWVCRRCGTRDAVDLGPCSRCGRDLCATCTACATFGSARSCEALIRMPVPGRREASGANTPSVAKDGSLKPLLEMPFTLSPPQQAASDALLQDDGRPTLVWAACGAGKTEVVYAAIERTLQARGRVLFAIPRRDIVIDLEERLRQVFPRVPVQAVYGGSVRKFADTPITLATTHQLLRFYHRFDLVVLDEVDAYPYRGSRLLRRAVERAAVPGGRTIFLTATPPDTLFARVRRGECRLVTIPARHHGHPLPVPEIVRAPELDRVRKQLLANERQIDLSRELVDTVQQALRTRAPLLVFVPAVNLVAPAARLFDSICRSGARPAPDALPLAAGIHSRDPRRDRLRQAFAAGEFPVLVATTVLERGVTLPGVNVIVWMADAEGIFDAAALVQMAGRVGRTASQPTGRVWFVAAKPNRPMEQAVRQIQELNRIADEAGYLHRGGQEGLGSQSPARRTGTM